MARSIILTDGEVALAVPEREDFKLDVVNDPFVRTWAQSPMFFWQDEEKAYEDNKGSVGEPSFAIIYKGEFVGLCGWKLKEAPIPQFWFGLYRNRFQGIGTRAIKLLLIIAFVFHNHDAAFAITMENNRASIRALEKAGFKIFGKTRKSFLAGRKKVGATWMVAYADRWLKENDEYVRKVLEQSGYDQGGIKW